MKIISGGQTGVDRAALDAALELGLPCGGWCPRGRRAEDGVIPARYPLRETDSDEYAVRTELNVRESDGTLIITRGRPSGGTAFTIAMARKYKRPYMVVDLASCSKGIEHCLDICRWISDNHIMTLNVAGPRESGATGIYEDAKEILLAVFQGGPRLK